MLPKDSYQPIYDLAHMYKRGEGIKQDIQMWAQLLVSLHPQGGNHLFTVEDYFQLGLPFYKAQKFELAVNWLNFVVGKGDVESCFLLGLCYLDGKGVKQDNTQAAYWFEVSAKRGIRECPV